MAFMATWRLPSSEVGPVECWELARLARIWESEVSFMLGSPFDCEYRPVGWGDLLGVRGKLLRGLGIELGEVW